MYNSRLRKAKLRFLVTCSVAHVSQFSVPGPLTPRALRCVFESCWVKRLAVHQLSEVSTSSHVMVYLRNGSLSSIDDHVDGTVRSTLNFGTDTVACASRGVKFQRCESTCSLLVPMLFLEYGSGTRFACPQRIEFARRNALGHAVHLCPPRRFWKYEVR